jgi:hypothetical protein
VDYSEARADICFAIGRSIVKRSILNHRIFDSPSSNELYIFTLRVSDFLLRPPAVHKRRRK